MPLRRSADGWTPTHRALAAAVGDALGVEAAAGTGGVDWLRFAALAERHAVQPLVRRSGWLAAQAVPPEVDARLHTGARRAAARSVRNLAALGAILRGAATEDLEVVVPRGLPLASWAYGDPLARQSADVNLLVAPAHLRDAASLLGRLGYEPVGPGDATGAEALPGAAAVTFVGDRAIVDLHSRLFANPALLPLDLSDPRNLTAVDIGGFAARTLAAEAAWWYAAVLGTTQRWSSMKRLADMGALVRARPALVSPVSLARAEAAGVDRCVATGLVLVAEVLGMPLPAAARSWAGTRQAVGVLARHGRRQLEAGGAGEGWSPAGVALELRMRGDRRYRWAAVRLALGAARHPVAPS